MNIGVEQTEEQIEVKRYKIQYRVCEIKCVNDRIEFL